MTAAKYPNGVLQIEPHTPTKPEIVAIATELDTDPDSAFGAVVRVWSWFTFHTADGVIPLTPDALDAAIGRRGLAAAMIAVGWLQFEAGRLVVPDFDRHCRPRSGAKPADARRQTRIANRTTATPQQPAPVRESAPEPKQSPAPVRAAAPVSRPMPAPVRATAPEPKQQPDAGPTPEPERDPRRTPNGTQHGAQHGTSSRNTGKTGTTGDFIKTGSTGTERPRLLERVTRADLGAVRNLAGLLTALCRESPIDGLHETDQSLRLIVGAAVRSLQVGRDPVALFVSIVSRRAFEFITDEQDQAAAAAIREWRADGVGTIHCSRKRSRNIEI